MLTDALRSIVVDILGADANAAINPEQRLEDFGVDSLMSIALVRALESNLRIALPKNAINLHPTLHRLADYLLLELNGPSALVNESAA